jgi:hypothetical protein
MLCFPCSTCQSPTHVTDLHSWMYGDPFCSLACDQNASARPAPEPRKTLLATHDLLLETGQLVLRSIPLARSAESSFETSATMSSDAMFGAMFLAGGLVAAAAASGIASAAADHSSDALTTPLWEIDQRVHRLLRQMMALHGLGYDVAGYLTPLVQQFGSLGGPTPTGAARTLRALHEYLTFLYHGVTRLGLELDAKQTGT